MSDATEEIATSAEVAYQLHFSTALSVCIWTILGNVYLHSTCMWHVVMVLLQVVDLLIALARAASTSRRRELIFDPFPTIIDPKQPSELALKPQVGAWCVWACVYALTKSWHIQKPCVYCVKGDSSKRCACTAGVSGCTRTSTCVSTSSYQTIMYFYFFADAGIW